MKNVFCCGGGGVFVFLIMFAVFLLLKYIKLAVLKLLCHPHSSGYYKFLNIDVLL